MFKNYTCIVLFILLCFKTNGQSKTFKKQLDSIQTLRLLSKNIDLDTETRIQYAKQASELSYKTEVDSVILNSNRALVWVYLDDKKYFRKAIRLGHKNLKLAYKLDNSINIAYTNKLLGYAYHNLDKSDSAYYHYYNSLKAFKFLNRYKDFIGQSDVISNIAILQRDERDYVGSQVNVIKAINLLLTIPQTEASLDGLWSLYNSLALNLNDLKDYKKSLEYYQKALDVSAKMEKNYESQLFTKINLAELYKETKNYKKALEIYEGLLKDKALPEKDLSSYGAILHNIAYAMFLDKDNDNTKIDSLFTKAHNIFEDLQLYYELAASGNDMSEFHMSIDQKDKALFHLKKAYGYGKKANENSEVLRALKMLSKLYEGNEGKAYLYEHIQLNDSLIDIERANRNKFARIQFETDQYIKETKRLSTQNILISIIASSVILMLGLLYFIKRQRSKNNQLVFDAEQERANQEIYSLLLNQQTKLEEGRLQERHRIAEDMHDGILSHLFGTRMGLAFLDVKANEETLKRYNLFLDELQDIENEVRDVSHNLKKDDIFSKNSFESILEQYLEQQSRIGHFKCQITKESPLLFEDINDHTKVAIYRVIQEAVQNSVKHAKASEVSINFSLKEASLQIVIKDDGIGFNTNKKHQGIGLKNMQSRVSKLEGTFKIEPKTNKGTTIHISIPKFKDDQTI